MDEKSLLKRCREIWQESGNIEDILCLLRSHGTSKVNSIKAVRTICAVPLGVAKDKVALSETWRDMLAASDEFHQTIEDNIVDVNSQDSRSGDGDS